ncbi:MAG TPA: hypothetical protein VM942_07450 [Acidimicrobiales bacterium]|nr:hypothetical protein [Acidimicrobiales bacterium]
MTVVRRWPRSPLAETATAFAASSFPDSTPDRRRARTATVVHVVSLGVGFAVVLWANRNQWFFGDEWAFLGRRGVRHGVPGLFEPHNEHWSTSPVLVYRAFYSLFGVRTYLPYVVVLVVVHLTAAHLLWRVMRRSGVDVAVATTLGALFVFLGAGSENLLWAFQIGFIGSVACGLGALLLVDHDRPFGRRDVAGWAVLVLGLTCSGIGVPMVAVAGVAVLLRRSTRGLSRRGLRRAALTVAVPAFVYLVWLTLAGREGLGERSVVDQLSKLSGFVWAGVSNALASTLGSSVAAVLVLAGLVAWMVWRRRLAVTRAAPAFACAAGVALLFLVLALGRAGLGTAQAGASRYVYVAVALGLPVAGLMLTDLAARGRAAELAVLAVVGLVVAYNGFLLGVHAHEEAIRERRIMGAILSAADVAVRGEPLVGAMPDPAYNPDVTVDILRRLARDGKLPPLVSRATDRMAAASHLQLHVDNHAIPGVPPRLGPLPAEVAQAPGAAPGCVVLTPQAPRPEVILDLDGPMSLAVRPSADGALEVTLQDIEPQPVSSEPRSFRVVPDVVVHVNVVAAVDRVVLGIPGGTTEVCGL